jgi:hypothetical protein
VLVGGRALGRGDAGWLGGRSDRRARFIEHMPGPSIQWPGGVDTAGLMPAITTTAWWIRPSGRSMSFKMV